MSKASQQNLVPQYGNLVDLRDAWRHADWVSSALQDFTDADFAASGNDGNVRTNYDDVEKARRSLDRLTPYGFRYALGARATFGARHGAGMVSLMDYGAGPMQRVLRKTTLHRTDLGFSRVRTINGWLNAQVVEGAGIDPQEAAADVVDTITKTAYGLGLTAVEVAQMPESPDKNPNLLIIEHTVDLKSHGFDPVRQGELDDRGITHTDVQFWRRAL